MMTTHVQLKPSNHNLTWWLSRVESFIGKGTEYKARCPAHDDRVNSLHLTVEPTTGEVLFHCFAGCKSEDIMTALDDREPHVPVRGDGKSAPRTSNARGAPQAPSIEAVIEWWERYTSISANKWQEWGAYFNLDGVNFTWAGSNVRKVRSFEAKEFRWDPLGSTPPLWPTVPDVLPDAIWITEGETDCGVLREAGLMAFATTKGASNRLAEEVWKRLAVRGVKEVFLPFDADKAGREGAMELVAEASANGIAASYVDLSRFLDPLLGEKDLRDLWNRYLDPERILEVLGEAIARREETDTETGRTNLDEFLGRMIETPKWLVDGVWLTGTVGMIVGAPKLGKSWLAIDLGMSVATGTPFLGTFPVANPGPVVHISKEDPDHLLQDRLEKIAASKGLAGSWDGHQLSLPETSNVPYYLDLRRSFDFTEVEEVNRLLVWLKEIKDRHGGMSLVIFDPILRMMGGVDEFKASEVGGSVFKTAERIRTELGTSVLLVHHRSKGGMAGKNSYGSIGFHAFSEATLYLSGEEPNEDGWVPVHSEYKSAKETEWSYRFPTLDESYEVEVMEGVPEGTSSSSRDLTQEIVNLLEASPQGLAVDELARGVEVSEIKVRSIVKDLEKNGKITAVKEAGPRTVKGGPRKNKWVLS